MGKVPSALDELFPYPVEFNKSWNSIWSSYFHSRLSPGSPKDCQWAFRHEPYPYPFIPPLLLWKSVARNRIWSYVSYGNELFLNLLEPVFVTFIRKSHHFQNRTWGKIYFTSCTVLQMMIFSTRPEGNDLRGDPKDVISVWNVTPISSFQRSERNLIKTPPKTSTPVDPPLLLCKTHGEKLHLELRFIQKWHLLDHLGGHFPRDVWKKSSLAKPYMR